LSAEDQIRNNMNKYDSLFEPQEEAQESEKASSDTDRLLAAI
jgi:hypothetical protein